MTQADDASIYAAFITHSMPTIKKRARGTRDGRELYEWGDLGSTPEQSAEDMGAIVHATIDEGLLCEFSGRLYVVSAGDDGPWAIEVATQADLVTDVSRDDVRALRREALAARDYRQADICERALADDCTAWSICVAVILAARGAPVDCGYNEPSARRWHRRYRP